MKKFGVFLFGIIVGVVLTVIVGMGLAQSEMESSDKLTYFDTPGEVMTMQTLKGTKYIRNFEVMQSLDNGKALAKCDEAYRTDLIVLLVNDDNIPYYDNQKVSAPKGKFFRQIGIYKYTNMKDMQMTVPIVKLMDDNE